MSELGTVTKSGVIEPRIRILTLAYACEPHKGSEPGAGWSMVRLLARQGRTTVITRRNNRTAIEDGLGECPELSGVSFVYVDLPRWLAWWKKGHRGVRVYYLLWQVAALVQARKLHRKSPFDLCWHVTMANAWLGSLGALVGPRFVYGPVGAGVSLPKNASASVGTKGRLYELARNAMRIFGRYLNPAARIAWRRATLILCQNPETMRWLPSRHQGRAVIYSNAIVDSVYEPRARERGQTVLFAARLLAWKGGELAIRAIAELPSWRMIVCGDGPDRRRLEALAEELGATDRIEWRGWLSRDGVEVAMREEADVFLLPSLHDEGSAAVVEAMFAGLPVVCLRHGGPALLVGQAGVTIQPDLPPEMIVEGIKEALSGPLPSDEIIERRCKELSVQSRATELTQILDRFGLLTSTRGVAG